MTTLRDLTADDIAALSGILAKLRPHGAPRWQPAGVRASLAKIAHFDAADALMAAIRLSQDRSADTPAQIAITSSECWREKVAEPIWKPQVLTPTERCGICSHPRHDGRCPRCPLIDDHAFEPDFKVRQGGAVDELRDIKAKATAKEPAAEQTTTTTPGAGRARVEAAAVVKEDA